jgi:hypothetical protein
MTGVIERLMFRFARTLSGIEQRPNTRFFFAPTRGLLTPVHWRDEMHLTPNGFDLAASAFDPNWTSSIPTGCVDPAAEGLFRSSLGELAPRVLNHES